MVQEVQDFESSSMRAAWMGVEAGLEVEGPALPGVDGSLVLSPSCWRSCAS